MKLSSTDKRAAEEKGVRDAEQHRNGCNTRIDAYYRLKVKLCALENQLSILDLKLKNWRRVYSEYLKLNKIFNDVSYRKANNTHSYLFFKKFKNTPGHPDYNPKQPRGKLIVTQNSEQKSREKELSRLIDVFGEYIRMEMDDDETLTNKIKEITRKKADLEKRLDKADRTLQDCVATTPAWSGLLP